MLHILLVEDNDSDVLLIREGLRRAEIDTDLMVARDGEDALDLLTVLKPDFVLLDINLPKLDGLTVLERCRELDSAPPVILLTSSNSDSDRWRALELGAREYLVKPTNFAAFVTMVKGVVERFGRSAPRTATKGE